MPLTFINQFKDLTVIEFCMDLNVVSVQIKDMGNVKNEKTVKLPFGDGENAADPL